MLNDTKYDKVKLLYKLSKICWFLEQHAIDNAEKEGDDKAVQRLKELKNDIEKHLASLEPMCK